jgi:histidine ammonia-lyase
MSGALSIGREPITVGDVARVARQGARVEVDPESAARVRASRAFVDAWLAGGRVAYGVNTGFGSLACVRISARDIAHLQRNLVRSHSVGVGEPLPIENVRAMLLLRAVALAQGYSGVRLEVVETLLQMLDKGVHPVIPAQGSVGASGDLAPLAHLALALIGEGEVFHERRRQPSGRVMKRLGIAPLHLGAKEGLALINGTQAMTSFGALALHDMAIALRSADIISAMSLEALMATDTVLHPRLHEVRRQVGQMAVAANMRRIVAESPLIASHKDCARVQDAYSLRCIPQVHGAARDVHRYALEVVEREINAVTDNPLVFPEEGLILSGGNFHGAPVALAMDAVALGLVYLCNISERRTYRLLDPALSGLPPFLSRASGLHSGLMLTQYTAAALASENKVLAHPSSADTIPTSAGQEDHVSMGMTSARKLARIVDHTFTILGIEALCAAQALDFRNPPAFGAGTRAAYLAIRERFRPVEEDRVLSGDIQAAADLLRSGSLVGPVEAACGLLD